MKKIILIIVSVFGIVVLLGILAIFVLVNILTGSSSPDPPSPEITYGEFPFKLVYELNGERITVEDTFICEYGGVIWNEGLGNLATGKAILIVIKKKTVYNYLS